MTKADKLAEAKSQIIRIRHCADFDVATGGGKRTTSTMGPHAAAHAHARKLFGDRPFNLVALSEPDAFRATVIQQEPCK